MKKNKNMIFVVDISPISRGHELVSRAHELAKSWAWVS